MLLAAEEPLLEHMSEDADPAPVATAMAGLLLGAASTAHLQSADHTARIVLTALTQMVGPLLRTLPAEQAQVRILHCARVTLSKQAAEGLAGCRRCWLELLTWQCATCPTLRRRPMQLARCCGAAKLLWISACRCQETSFLEQQHCSSMISSHLCDPACLLPSMHGRCMLSREPCRKMRR